MHAQQLGFEVILSKEATLANDEEEEKGVLLSLKNGFEIELQTNDEIMKALDRR